MSTCYTIEKAEYRALKDENAELRADLLLAQRIIGQISHEGFELIDENRKLHNENVKLLKKIYNLENDAWAEGFRDGCEAVSIVTKEGHKVYTDEIAELREQVKRIHSAYVGVIEKYEQSEEAIMDDYSGTTSYDRGMQRIKQECDELRYRFDDTLAALGVEVPE